MRFFASNQQIDHLQGEINRGSRPLTGEQLDASIPDDALILPLLGGDLLFQRRKSGHIADGEKVVRYQHGRRRGANRRNDAPGKMKLAYRFNQQRAVAKVLRAFNAAGQNKDIEISVGHFHQRRIGQQLNAARADDGQAAIAGDAGGGDLYAAANE